jgi:hypothetical protein
MNEPEPDQILQVGLGFWSSKALLSAVEMGLFTELAVHPEILKRCRDAWDYIPARRATSSMHWWRSNFLNAATENIPIRLRPICSSISVSHPTLAASSRWPTPASIRPGAISRLHCARVCRRTKPKMAGPTRSWLFMPTRLV